jgi:serine phosphatase RsbU (regulator of sigma subunit)
MSRILWFGSIVLLLLGVVLQVTATQRFISQVHPQVLTTPNGLALIPLTFSLPDNVFYLRPYAEQTASGKASQLRYIQALLPVYAAVFFFWFTALFLYVFSRVRRLERAYILFAAAVVAYLLLFIDFFTWHVSGNIFLFYNVLIIGPFLYLFRSAYQLPTQGWLYLLILVVSLALYAFFPIRSAADELAFIQLLGGIFLATFIYCGYLFFWSEGHREQIPGGRRLWAARIFSFSLIFAVALPPTFFFMLYYTPVQVDVNYNALFFLPAFFPIIFITLSLRWGLVNFHIPISLTAVRFMYFAFFGFLYWFTVGFSLGELYQSDATQIRHFAILAVFLLLMDPARTALMLSLDSYASARRKILDAILLQSSGQIANPRRANSFIERLAVSLSEGLGCYWAKVIMSRDLFTNWDSDSETIVYLPADDPFWVQAKNWVRGRKYPLLTQTFIGPVRDFLQSRGAFLAIGMEKFKAGIMVSERKDNLPFYSEDVRFLRQVAREAEILIQNYLFLIENVKMKRRERELAYNARIQKKVIPSSKQFEHFTFWSYSRAYESVTGDYMDLMQTGLERFVVLLGDVSGHGISSGYLVAFARAYLRGALTGRGETLRQAVGGLNMYLTENYRGNEFITLFALQFEFIGDQVAIRYINAGQHPALIHTRQGLLRLDDSQRLLGVIENDYRESELLISRWPLRIILFSDGAFDVFNKSGKILGQKKFLDWVESSLDKAPAEQLAFLRQRIEAYTASGEESDDLALIIIEMN